MTPPPADPAGTLVDRLTALRSALAEVRLVVEVPGLADQRTARAEVLHQLDDYLLPRLASIDAPLLAVVGGSTGAGKSTLVSSLVGRVVSEPGVLRPTTRAPVLVCHPDDRRWFADDRVLPGLARTDAPASGEGVLQLVTDAAVPAGLALLDAPDVDSVERGNRELAAQLLGAADLWLFVTSAARYADQVPWRVLTDAADRSASVALVLDRVPPSAVTEVADHLRSMMRERGLGEAPLFTLTEGDLDGRGLLPPARCAEIRDWLVGLAEDADRRAEVVRQTLSGAVAAAARRAREVAEADRLQEATLAQLREEADAAYRRATREVVEASADGTLLRGELLARWQEFVGTGELLRSLEERVGRLRDRVASWVRGRPPQAAEVSVAVETGLSALLREHAEDAAERTLDAWSATASGRWALAAGDGDLGRASRDFPARADRAIRDWQQAVVELVRAEGAQKRATARVLALGVNGLAVALMVVVFVHTAGLTGAEAGIAGGSAVLGQKLLEAVFGDQAVRRLTEQARVDLAARVEDLMAQERARWTGPLDALDLDDGAADRLVAAAEAVDRAVGESGSW